MARRNSSRAPRRMFCSCARPNGVMCSCERRRSCAGVVGRTTPALTSRSTIADAVGIVTPRNAATAPMVQPGSWATKFRQRNCGTDN